MAEEFGDPQVVQRLHLDIEKKQDWPVASLFHSAAVLSRFTSTRAKADEKLKEAFGWLRWRATQTEDQRGLHRYSVNPEDVAAGLEAMFRETLNNSIAVDCCLDLIRQTCVASSANTTTPIQ